MKQYIYGDAVNDYFPEFDIVMPFWEDKSYENILKWQVDIMNPDSVDIILR